MDFEISSPGLLGVRSFTGLSRSPCRTRCSLNSYTLPDIVAWVRGEDTQKVKTAKKHVSTPVRPTRGPEHEDVLSGGQVGIAIAVVLETWRLSGGQRYPQATEAQILCLALVEE